MSSILQVSTSEAIAAQFSAPSWWPANSPFLWRVTGLMARSAVLLSSSIRPSSRKRVKPSQRFSAYFIASLVAEPAMMRGLVAVNQAWSLSTQAMAAAAATTDSGPFRAFRCP